MKKYRQQDVHHTDGDNELSPLMMPINKNNNEQRGAVSVQNGSIVRNAATRGRYGQDQATIYRRMSWNRRLFLFLTEPESSSGATIFYFVLMTAIFLTNVVMILQSMDYFQFTPTDCVSCGGSTPYMFEDDEFVDEDGTACVCPPAPIPITHQIIDYCMYFLTIEFCLRIIVFVPLEEESSPTIGGRIWQWFGYLTETSTIIDALGIFPYYLENLPTSFVAIRLFRLFRILQIVRLGKYNEMFLSFTNVMQKSTQYLKLLLLVLTFGAAFFGSMVYWLEKGTWKYHEPSGEYRFLRISVDGVTEEPTPFNSIPSAFWWFMVTATTVGYGDYYPTSTGGKWCATFAMLMGVLVIAFPVSVFSDLWSYELKHMKAFKDLATNDDDDDDDNDSEKKMDHHRNVNKNDEGNINGTTLNDQSGLPWNVQRTPERYSRTRLAGTRYNNFPTTSLSSFTGEDNEVVMMSKQDLEEIVECVYTIRENERQLKQILRKYHHPEVVRNNGGL